MIKDLEKGSTLLVTGPTRVTLIEGNLEVFGKSILPKEGEIYSDDSQFERDDVLIIPGANQYPLYAVEKSKLEIYSSKERENLKIIEENSIPDRWTEIKDSILADIKKRNEGKPIIIMVLGISSGKTSILKYLANNFLREGLKGGYLDSDLGQTIFLPTTISIAEVKSPIISGEELESEAIEFIGATYPKGNLKFIVAHSCKNLIDNYISKHQPIDYVLLDSDGWIRDAPGLIYKNFFIKTVDPDVIIVFHDETIKELKEIEKIASKRKDRKIYLIKEYNKFFYERDKLERRFTRQAKFAAELESYRKISIPLSKNKIEFVKNEYNEETNEMVEEKLNIYELVKLPYHYVIVALLDEDSNLIKLALLFVINLDKDYVLIFSDLTYKEQVKVKKVLLGSLRLSVKGNHQGFLYL